MAASQNLLASGRTPALAAPDYGLGAGEIVFADGFEALQVELIEVGAGPFPLPQDSPEVQADGVGRDGGGDLVRDLGAVANRYVWIPNDREGTVSKVDITTGAEVARYASVTHDTAHGRVIDHVGRAYPVWNADTNGNMVADNRPQYVAVDYAGDAWVANVANDQVGTQSTLTKIIGDSARCPDLNGNLVVDTSQPVNGTPGIQIADAAEFFAADDECVAMTVVVGALGVSGGGLRALAIDADRSGPGNPWAGTYSEQAFYQIDGTTGALMQRVATPGVKGYSAAIDSLGRLWATDDCCGSSPNLGRIDTLQNPAPFAVVASLPPFLDAGNNPIDDGSLAVAVDLANRVWIAGSPFGGMLRYDPGSATFIQATITGYLVGGDARGAAVDSRGNVWTSFIPDAVAGKVARFDAATATSTGVFVMSDSSGGAAQFSAGVGVDRAGDVWTSNRQTSNVSRLHIDATSGEPAPHPTTGDIVDVFPVGPDPNVHSDFTGMAYRRVTRPDGDYHVLLPTCAGAQTALWLGVEWNATIPAGTRVELYVRTGNDAATIGQAPPQGPWTSSPADLQLTPGPVGNSIQMKLTLRLISEDPLASPTLHSYRVTRACPVP
jgi:hypothetical protein